MEYVEDEQMAVRRCEGDDGEDEKGDEREEQVGDWASESGEVVVADNLVEVPGEDRGGFCPADEQTAEEVEADEGAKDDERGKKECADWVNVLNGVESDAAKFAGGVIAETGRGPGVGTFVDAEREKEKHEFEDGNDECAGFQLRAPRG
jgi:hypothetical protein